jgi:UDPglucose 6-dehydrogenase
MKIGIIGNGFVGKATQLFIKNYYLDIDSSSSPTRSEILPTDAATATQITDSAFRPFYRHEHFTQIDVYIYDIRPDACVPLGITLETLDRECDLLFFCLPTPLHHDGTCYTHILEHTLSRCKNPFKIIRSTVPVGFSAKHLCYFMPEFLTEANWETDFREMKEWIVGLPPISSEGGKCGVDIAEINVFQERIHKLIRTSHRNGAIYSPTIEFCESNEAEMLKLMKNCFLSAKVSIMNEFYDFCGATHTDYETVATMAKRDIRMGASHFQVPGPDGLRGFGGTCFPKDTHSLYCQMNAHGVTPQIYPAIITRNDTVDRPEREWSRDVWRTTIPLPSPTSKVVVVFSDGAASESSYLISVVKTNLAKNNVVIMVVRGADSDSDKYVSLSTHTNFIIKHHPSAGTPLFFPRVDECYYSAHRNDTTLDTIRGVMNIIDLWNSHKEMILYVIKHRVATPIVSSVSYHDAKSESEIERESESGTEGFDSDNYEIIAEEGAEVIDYAKIIEEYFRSKLSIIPNQKRGLIVLF